MSYFGTVRGTSPCRHAFQGGYLMNNRAEQQEATRSRLPANSPFLKARWLSLRAHCIGRPDTEQRHRVRRVNLKGSSVTLNHPWRCTSRLG